MLERLCEPNVITIEGDVLPAERSHMGKRIVADNLTLGAQLGKSAPEIDGVPEDDSRDGEIEARGPVSLIFEGAVADFAETVKEHRPGERVARLALVEPGIRSPAQSRSCPAPQRSGSCPCSPGRATRAPDVRTGCVADSRPGDW